VIGARDHSKMPNWTIEQDYAFTATLDENGWAWEFLRRNPKYRNDYQVAQACMSPHQSKAWCYHVTGGDEPITSRLGKKWEILGPIHDPNVDRPPIFMPSYPREPNFDDAAEFFDATPDEGGPALQLPEFATLVFNLHRPLAPQIERASKRLKDRQALVAIQKGPHKGSEKWPLYLRILDARETGATTADIVNSIKDYALLGNDVADGYPASKALSANLESANSLVERALTILK
jgi:hypothetical protein